MNIDIGYSRKMLASRSISSSRAAQGSEGGNSVYGQDNATNFYPCAQGGISFVWMSLTRVSLEFGADFTHIFISDMPTGLLMPYAAVGFKF